LAPSKSANLRNLIVKTDLLVIKESPQFFNTENLVEFLRQCILTQVVYPDAELGQLIVALTHEFGTRLVAKDKAAFGRLSDVIAFLKGSPSLCSPTLVSAVADICKEDRQHSPEYFEFLATHKVDVQPLLRNDFTNLEQLNRKLYSPMVLTRLDILATKKPADTPPLTDLKYSNLNYILDSPFLSEETLPGFSNLFHELNVPKSISNNPNSRLASFSGIWQLTMYFKYFKKYPFTKEDQRFLNMLSEAEIGFLVDSFYSLQNIEMTDYSFFMYLLKRYAKLVNFDEIMVQTIYSDQMIKFLVKSNKIDEFHEFIISNTLLEPPEMISFTLSLLCRLDLFGKTSDKLLSNLLDALEKLFSGPQEQIPMELTSVNFLISVYNYLKKNSKFNPRVTAFIISQVSKSKTPNLELLLDLLKSLVGQATSDKSAAIQKAATQKKAFYLNKVDKLLNLGKASSRG